jgi:hypothetical protein
MGEILLIGNIIDNRVRGSREYSGKKKNILDITEKSRRSDSPGILPKPGGAETSPEAVH